MLLMHCIKGEAKPWYRNVLLGLVTGKAPEEHLSTDRHLTATIRNSNSNVRVRHRVICPEQQGLEKQSGKLKLTKTTHVIMNVGLQARI